MGKVSFPLHNVRKDVLNNWHLAELTEDITVPSQVDENGFYTVSLTEIPESSSTKPVTIPGLTEFRGNPYNDKTKKITLAANQFYVNYANGTILFNSVQSGGQFTVTYWGKGSLVEADDVNDLNERVVSTASTVASVQETVAQNQESISAAIADVNDVKTQTAAVVASVAEINSDLQSVHTDLNSKANQSDVDTAIGNVQSSVDAYFVSGGEVDTRIDTKLADYVSNEAYASDQETKAASYDEKYAPAAISETVSGVSSRVETLENAGYITSAALEGLATESFVTEQIGEIEIPDVSSFITAEALEPLATKEEIADFATESYVDEKVGEIVVPDVSSFITAEALEPYATKQEIPDVTSFITAEALEPYATKEEIPDVSSFVTAADVSAAISDSGHVSASQLTGLVAVNGVNASSAQHKITTKSANNKDLTSMIWNESSGGGAMFTNNEAGYKSFIGVNNGDDNIWVQGYATNISTRVGSRITLNPDGFYYTKGHSNGTSFTADHEVVVKKEINDVNSQLEANYENAVSRLSDLERKMEMLTRTNLEPVSSTANASFNDASADLVLSADVPVSENSTIVANSVEVQSLNVQSSMVSMTSNGIVSVSNYESTGSYPKSRGNAQVVVKSDDYVEFKNSTFGMTSGYNCIEIGLDTSSVPPKGVLVENCDFTQALSNNAIIVFGHQEDAVVRIKNCTFGNVSNVLRISNRTNAKGTFIFEDCTFAGFDSDLNYTGAVICEDYTSKSVAKEEENNLFAPEKIKIKFINCTGPDGNKIVGDPDPSVYSGSRDANQLVYVYNDYGYNIAYDAARYPRVTFE